MLKKEHTTNPFDSGNGALGAPRWEIFHDFLPELTGNEDPEALAKAFRDFADVLRRNMEGQVEGIRHDITNGAHENIIKSFSYTQNIATLLLRIDEFRYSYSELHAKVIGHPAHKAAMDAFTAGRKVIADAKQVLDLAFRGISAERDRQISATRPDLVERQKIIREFFLPSPPDSPDVIQAFKEWKAARIQPKLTAKIGSSEAYGYIKGRKKSVLDRISPLDDIEDRNMAAEALSLKFMEEGFDAAREGISPLAWHEKCEGIPEGFTHQLADGLLRKGKKLRASYGGVKVSWDKAQENVVEAFRNFHPALGTIAQKAMDEHWIDAVKSASKKGGAFSAPGVPERWWEKGHPRVLMTFDGTVNAALTLAHELAHAAVQYMEMMTPEELRELGVSPFERDRTRLSSMAMHETFAKFGEKILAGHMLDVSEGTSIHYDLAKDLEAYNTLSLYDIGRFRAEDALRTQMHADDYQHMLTRQHISQTFRKEMERVSNGYDRMDQLNRSHDIWMGSSHMLEQSMYYQSNYFLAEAASRRVFNLLELTREHAPRENLALRQSIVDAMASGSAANHWDQTLRTLGVDVQSPAFMSAAKRYVSVTLVNSSPEQGEENHTWRNNVQKDASRSQRSIT